MPINTRQGEWVTLNKEYYSRNIYSTINRGVFAQNLKFDYLYKSQGKSYELLRTLYDMVPLKSPQQFVGFAVTLVKIFKFKTLCKDTPINGINEQMIM